MKREAGGWGAVRAVRLVPRPCACARHVMSPAYASLPKTARILTHACMILTCACVLAWPAMQIAAETESKIARIMARDQTKDGYVPRRVRPPALHASDLPPPPTFRNLSARTAYTACTACALLK